MATDGTDQATSDSNPPPSLGKRITVLSIDGGGVRGLIPAMIIDFLESELQKLDGPDARIADYFDVISGTSTGGLVATMLAAPGENNKPLFAGKDIVQFYLDHSPKIFPQQRSPFLSSVLSLVGALAGPKYNGKYLRSTIQELLGNTKLNQTLTNIVIPTFDIKISQPIIFSTYETEKNPWKNALLSDICISTSAAPTYLPGHYFETHDDKGATKSFNLIDGGVAANNPTLSAMSEVTKQILKSNTDFASYEPVDYSKLLVLSIGTGTPKKEMKYSSQMSARWGLFGWLYNGGNTPIIDIFSQASSEMVDIHLAHVFEAHDSEDRYLRIQDDTLTGDATSVDKSTEKNLQNLVEIGKKLLEKPVSRVNLETGLSEPVVDAKGGTTSNGERLVYFAKKLSNERKRRQGNLASVA